MRTRPFICALLCVLGAVNAISNGPQDTVEDVTLVDTSDNFYARARALLDSGDMDGFDDLYRAAELKARDVEASISRCAVCVAGCHAAFSLAKIQKLCTKKNPSCRHV